jgi:peroxiredoxin
MVEEGKPAPDFELASDKGDRVNFVDVLAAEILLR